MSDVDREVGAPVIEVYGLRKAYGSVVAVADVSFEVRRGEIFGLLGPNGAGKTTTTEILEGYRHRDGGEVRVLGVDPASPTSAWRDRMGIVLQTCQVEPELTVRESLELFAGYYRDPRPVDEVIELVGLRSAARRRAGKLSGGQQRRLDVGLGLIGNPELLFLDEPTTGFDPSARRQFWDVIIDLRRFGTTVVLTTHYMDEAQALADRVAVIVEGRVVDVGPIPEIGGRARAAARISFTLPSHVSLAELPASLASRPGGRDGQVIVRTHSQVQTLRDLIAWADDRGIELPDLEVTLPSLEDVYLELASGNERR